MIIIDVLESIFSVIFTKYTNKQTNSHMNKHKNNHTHRQKQQETKRLLYNLAILIFGRFDPNNYVCVFYKVS